MLWAKHAGAIALALCSGAAAVAAEPLVASFRRDVQPVLTKYCYDCHGDGHSKGGITLDEFTDAASLRNHDLWLKVLKNVRAGVMPPAEEEHPVSAPDAAALTTWIRDQAFGLNPHQPDPGKVTVRRLNRVEYRNTVRDLLGVDFDTEKEFPADDTGHGFDNIADVLTISPLLMEKFIDAAQAIVARGVVTTPRAVRERPVFGRAFEVVSVDLTLPTLPSPAEAPGGVRGAPPVRRPAPTTEGNSLVLSYYTPAVLRAKHRVEHAGRYQVVVELSAHETYADNLFDLNRCQLVFRIDGEKVLEQEFVREGYGKKFEFAFEREWTPGEHELAIEIIPARPDVAQHRNLRLRLNAVRVRGPLAPEHWVTTPGYEKFFAREIPADVAGRRAYAREVLGAFATRAFRRPVEPETLEKLVDLAEFVSSEPEGSFETGVAQAIAAVLASPAFLFREDRVEPLQPGQAHPLIDEYSLASRLSYFLWSSMPDDELMRLASERRLRANLGAQVNRMLNDPRAQEFVRNFAGQWLQARDIATVTINEVDVYLRENPNPEYVEARATLTRLAAVPPARRTPAEAEEVAKARSVVSAFMRQPRPALTDALRRAMQQETEMAFAHVIKEDRSLLELLDADYTFLNEALAKHYGIEGVTGSELRKVTLPPGSPRGGVLTHGSVLTVTSNPTRTSPVKRGVFILEAILGIPPAPPPPNIPSLEDVAPAADLARMTLREQITLHAENSLCRSCHSRMDPLGLALENFNAMGAWRTRDMDQPVEPAGKLITGESFADVRELKRILATSRRHDFYHSVAEKMLMYALGRSVEYYDLITLDHLAEALEASGGRPSVLLHGIVNSAAFQQRRVSAQTASADLKSPPATRPIVSSKRVINP